MKRVICARSAKTMIDQMIRVTNDKNITFNVVLSKDKKEQNLVSFYDTRYNHTQ